MYIEHPKKDQQGMTVVAWLIVLLMLGFILMIVSKIVPMYMSSYGVEAALESLRDDDVGEISNGMIRDRTMKRLGLNDVEFIKKDQIIIKKYKRKKLMTVSISYEIRKHIISNIDAVASFSQKIELNY